MFPPWAIYEARLWMRGERMISRVRTLACTAILFFVSALSVFASSDSLRVVVTPVSNQVVAIRYQTGTKEKGTWKEVEAKHPTLLLEAFNSERDILFVQQKETNKNWSRSYTYRYNTQTNSWEVTLPTVKKPLFIDSMDIRPYALFPTGPSSVLYSYVTGAALKLNFSLDARDPLYGYGEIGYSQGPSKSDWVDSMQAINVSAGMGHRMNLGKHFEFAPELGYGLIIHVLYGDLDQDGTKAYETFIDQQVRLSLNFSFAPTESYELFVAPVGVLFFEKAKVAAFSGFQAGMRFNF